LPRVLSAVLGGKPPVGAHYDWTAFRMPRRHTRNFRPSRFLLTPAALCRRTERQMTHRNVKPGSAEPALFAVHDPSPHWPTRAAAAAPPTVASL